MLISSPGNYSLTSNIVLPDDSTTAAVLITASDVTLDLGGYVIKNRMAESPECCGVAILADRVSVRNGSISGFDFPNQCAVAIRAGCSGYILKDLRIGLCETGIVLNSENYPDKPTRSGVVEGCAISGAAIGILAFPSVGITIRSCSIDSSAVRQGLEGEGSGMLLRGRGYMVENCTLTGNAHGIRVEAGSATFRQCIMAANRNTGAYIAGSGCTLAECEIYGNGLMGLVTTGAATVLRDCTIAENGGPGMVMDRTDKESSSAAMVVNSLVRANGAEGILNKGAGGMLVEKCVVRDNAGPGLSLVKGDIYRDTILMDKIEGAENAVDGGGNHVGQHEQ